MEHYPGPHVLERFLELLVVGPGLVEAYTLERSDLFFLRKDARCGR